VRRIADDKEEVAARLPSIKKKREEGFVED
jgi:hypothetical protein